MVRDASGNRLATTKEDQGREELYTRYKSLLEECGVDPADPNWFLKLKHPTPPEFKQEDVENLIASISTHTIET